MEEETEQEKVGRSFSGCEASTCIFISTDCLDGGVRMLRGVARLVLVGDKYEYKEELVSDRAVGEIVIIFCVCVCVYMFVCVYVSVYLFVYVSVCLFVCVSVYLCV